MSEEKKNMEDLLQSELDLGDTEAVGAADDRSNVTAEPSSASIFSTKSVSPSLTLYCLPPVTITAYIQNTSS